MTGRPLAQAGKAFDKALLELARSFGAVKEALDRCDQAQEALADQVRLALDELGEPDTDSRDEAISALEDLTWPEVDDLRESVDEILHAISYERSKLEEIPSAAELVSRAR